MDIVSVIVPCRNEVEHIDQFLASVREQDGALPHMRLQVIIADGMSNDGTRSRLALWQSRWPDLVVIDNPHGIVSAGLNLAIQRASGEIVVRMDVHTIYAANYVAECCRVLVETNATCVGGPWKAEGPLRIQRAIARAFESPLGSGGALSRRTDYSGPVDTVYLGAWRRADLLRLGGFDERLVRNQDDELNLRVVRSGGTVWQSSTIQSTYTPRASFGALFAQFLQYGYWKVPVILKHGWPASPRHMAPFLFIASILLLAIVGFAIPGAAIAASVLALAYVLTVIAVARCPQRKGSLPVALAIACMHIGYGVGFGLGLVDHTVLKKTSRKVMIRITR